METRELICIGCPLGCGLTVTVSEETISVSGHTCKRGEDYARKEVLSPSRTVTSTVRVIGGILPVVSVKTSADIPKDKIFDCMKEIRELVVEAPVELGQILIPDCCKTGISVIATRSDGKKD